MRTTNATWLPSCFGRAQITLHVPRFKSAKNIKFARSPPHRCFHILFPHQRGEDSCQQQQQQKPTGRGSLRKLWQASSCSNASHWASTLLLWCLPAACEGSHKQSPHFVWLAPLLFLGANASSWGQTEQGLSIRLKTQCLLYTQFWLRKVNHTADWPSFRSHVPAFDLLRMCGCCVSSSECQHIHLCTCPQHDCPEYFEVRPWTVPLFRKVMPMHNPAKRKGL